MNTQRSAFLSRTELGPAQTKPVPTGRHLRIPALLSPSHPSPQKRNTLFSCFGNPSSGALRDLSPSPLPIFFFKAAYWRYQFQTTKYTHFTDTPDEFGTCVQSCTYHHYHYRLQSISITPKLPWSSFAIHLLLLSPAPDKPLVFFLSL